ncbi:hypothetical protein KEM48_005973 [Puccinia striiformis f. sp. tritici PST-130]|nr:hypothetical protein KEM48_005973 [Puccinia striiformis f. sp. tritici PST-130]
MHLSSLLPIVALLLIQGGVTYVQSWGCKDAKGYNFASCVHVYPDLAVVQQGGKRVHWHVQQVIPPWDVNTYNCHKGLVGYGIESCCYLESDSHGEAIMSYWTDRCRNKDGTPITPLIRTSTEKIVTPLDSIFLPLGFPLQCLLANHCPHAQF